MTRVQRRKCQIECVTFDVQLIVKPPLCASGGHEGSRETGSGCESVRGAASVVSRRTTHSQAHHPLHAALLISVRSDPASSEQQAHVLLSSAGAPSSRLHHRHSPTAPHSPPTYASLTPWVGFNTFAPLAVSVWSGSYPQRFVHHFRRAQGSLGDFRMGLSLGKFFGSARKRLET